MRTANLHGIPVLYRPHTGSGCARRPALAARPAALTPLGHCWPQSVTLLVGTFGYVVIAQWDEGRYWRRLAVLRTPHLHEPGVRRSLLALLICATAASVVIGARGERGSAGCARRCDGRCRSGNMRACSARGLNTAVADHCRHECRRRRKSGGAACKAHAPALLRGQVQRGSTPALPRHWRQHSVQ
jgi:hypothetical protein